MPFRLDIFKYLLDDPLGIAIPWEEKYGSQKDGKKDNQEDNEAK